MQKITCTTLFLFSATSNVFGCINCNKAFQYQLILSTRHPNLLLMSSAFIGLACLVGLLCYYCGKTSNSSSGGVFTILRPVLCAAIIIGIGIGGFIDGIVLHQLFQWHQMLSNKVSPDGIIAKNVNMFWDGIFHLFTLIVTLIGITQAWHTLQKVGHFHLYQLLLGGLLIGWALFNVIEGVINHHLLELHHVNEYVNNPELYDYGFLVLSLLIFGSGIGLVFQEIKQQKMHSDLK